MDGIVSTLKPVRMTGFKIRAVWSSVVGNARQLGVSNTTPCFVFVLAAENSRGS